MQNTGAAAEMPKYKCYKEVWALKIKRIVVHAPANPSADLEAFIASDKFQGGHIFPEGEIYAPIAFDADWYRKHKPEEGGYYVVYKDGYKSYSPAKAFEEGYQRI